VCFNQVEGDLVVLGPGCEHWVRSFGKAVQTAWNFGTMDKWQLTESIARMLVNSKINFKVRYIQLHFIVNCTKLDIVVGCS